VGGLGGSGVDSDTAGTGGAEEGEPEQRCVPNEAVCEGDIATTCKVDGSGFATGGVKCSSQQTCQEGVCLEHECDPGELACNEGNVQKCAEDGLSWFLEQTCGDDEYCDAKGASCEKGVCAPDEPVCVDDRAMVCNATGSGYVGGGTVCKSTETCQGGACLPHVCTPQTTFCEGQDLKLCDDDGLGSSTKSTCVKQACVEDAQSASCQGNCMPGQRRCTSANAADTCSSLGDYGAAVDCAAATPTCSGEGTCGLLVQPQELEAMVWYKNRLMQFGAAAGSEVNTTATTAPDGSNDAELVREDATLGTHSVEQILAIDATKTYTFSVYLKGAGADAMLALASPIDGASYSAVRVDLAAGTAQSGYAKGTAQYVGNAIAAVGDGWYKITLTGSGTTTASNQLRAVVYLLPSPNGNSSYQGAATAAAYVWGAQVVPYAG
jgi:hypothetical protein